jgi:uncharacterized damage-inducible protein DinB
MNRKNILLYGWDTAYDHEGWYPPLKDALMNVNHEQAQWKPIGRASNTIWELVNHLLYYKERFLTRLDGTEFSGTAENNDETFLAADELTAADWKQAVGRLATVHAEIKKRLTALADNDFDKLLPDAPIGGQVLSLVTHDAYHTGQIVLIRKLQASWPESRDV